jgi:hypothetical protein
MLIPTTDSVSANDQQNDALYLSTVTIGGQKMVLDFDTGSSDLWVMSTHLEAQKLTQLKNNGHNIYDPLKTGKLMKVSNWEIEYGDGSTASGDVVADTLKMASLALLWEPSTLSSQIRSTPLSRT